jgi:hypothetical protein
VLSPGLTEKVIFLSQRTRRVFPDWLQEKQLRVPATAARCQDHHLPVAHGFCEAEAAAPSSECTTEV